jgi:cytochrome c
LRLHTSLILLAAAAALTACGSGKDNSASQTAAESAAPATPPALDGQENKKLVAELGPAYANADLANGQTRFALCRSCHTVTKGGPNMTGPNLYGLFGRKSASVADYTYSDGLKAMNVTWDAAHLDAWIKDPKAVVSGTKMSFMGLKDDKERTDLIAYLKVASSGGAN